MKPPLWLLWSSHALPPEQRHVIAYDSLVSNTAAATGALFRFLGVAAMNATSTYVKTGGHRLAERRARAKLHDQASKLLQMWHDTGRAAVQLHGV